MQILTRLPGRAQLFVAWIVALALFAVLGLLRHSTSVEYSFASAAIVPVFLVAWTGGLRHGLAASLLAASMWVVTELLSGYEYSGFWVPVLNGLIRLASYWFVCYLTCRVRTLLNREVELSTHDELTSLLNRRAFLEAGEAEASRAQRYSRPLAVVFLDLDDFKKLNDSHGHCIGDAALQAVAASLGKTLRATDTLARLGGDEFAVILPEIDAVSALETGNKIASAVADALRNYPPVSASIGIAWFEKGERDFPAMLKVADALMYEKKDEGKGGLRMQEFR